MSLADELLADLEDDNEELEEVKIKVEDEDDGKRLDSRKLVIVSRCLHFKIIFCRRQRTRG